MTLNQTEWNMHIRPPALEEDWRLVDGARGLPNDQQIRKLAGFTDANHGDQRDDTAAWRTPMHRAVGLFGERAFARVFNLPMDQQVRHFGNGRTNATIIKPDGREVKVDVITRTPLPNGDLPDMTIKRQGMRDLADVRVLIIWLGDGNEPVFAGWISRQRAESVGALMTFKSGITNRVVPIGLLTPMWMMMLWHDPHHPLAYPSDEPLPLLTAGMQFAGGVEHGIASSIDMLTTPPIDSVQVQLFDAPAAPPKKADRYG